MLRVLKWLLILALLPVVFVLWLALFKGEEIGESVRQETIADVLDEVAVGYEMNGPRYIEDQQAAVQYLPFLAPVDGPDAGPYLNPRVEWWPASWHPADSLDEWKEQTGHNTTLGPLPEKLDKQLDHDQWLLTPIEDLRELDTSFLGELPKYGYWDFVSGGPTEGQPWRHVGPFPEMFSLTQRARARLRVAHESGGLPRAVEEVLALARLLYTTENLLAGLTAARVLRDVIQLHEHFGLTSPLPGDVEATRGLGDALYSTAIVFGLMSPTDLRDGTKVGRCIGLAEGGGWSNMLSPLLREDWSDEYERVDRELEESDCRLTALRQAWRDEDVALQSLVFIDRNHRGATRTTKWLLYLRYFPGAKRALGEFYLGLGSPIWAAKYTDLQEEDAED